MLLQIKEIEDYSSHPRNIPTILQESKKPYTTLEEVYSKNQIKI